MPESINITVKYDKVLEAIVGVSEHPVIMSQGCPFGFLLECILMDYPKIKKKYPPGVLRFLVNGVAPKTYSPLFDGDEVCFWTE
jgi:hypothetical protein